MLQWRNERGEEGASFRILEEYLLRKIIQPLTGEPCMRMNMWIKISFVSFLPFFFVCFKFIFRFIVNALKGPEKMTYTLIRLTTLTLTFLYTLKITQISK